MASSSTADAGRAAGAPLPAVVLISGQGSNLLAIAAAARAGLPLHVACVLSDRASAPGLARAAALGLATRVIASGDFPDRAAHDAALAAAIDAHAPAVVVLAGYLRILTPAFVARYAGRLLNIHPSLLPTHPGLHTHRRALAAGDTVHGATVHYVTAELDGGPRIAQSRLRVAPGDDEASLSARVQAREHRLYPTVLDWLARGRLHWNAGRPTLDGRALAEPIIVEDVDAPA